MRHVQVSSRTVPVAFLVRTGLEARNVRINRSAGQHEEGVGAATAALLPLPEPHGLDVRNEVRLPDAPAPELALRGEVLVFTAEAVLEVVLAVPDEVLVAQELAHHLWQVRHREKSEWLEAAAVVVLHGGVERDREEGALAELEAGL